VFIETIMKYPIYMTSVVVTSNTLVLVLLSSRAYAHDLLLVSVLASKVEHKLSNDAKRKRRECYGCQIS
jgi:hypothetical protein